MKTADVRLKQGFLFAAALFCLTFAAAATAQVAGNTEYCEVALRGCPQSYDGDTLVVPLSVIALSTKVQQRTCGIQDSSLDMGTPPAVMFIIDHSTSMGGNTGNDANGNRFRVTKALIDSIYNVYPKAEVGVVIFANGLVFKSERDSNLVDFSGLLDDSGGVKTSQAYLPLMQLDQPAKKGGSAPFTNAADPKSIDVLRGMFTVSANRDSITGGPAEISGTDITIAFEAALEAFEKTKKPKENQYIIFLSDGLPIQPNTGGGYAVNPSQRCNVFSADGIPGKGTQQPLNPRCEYLLDFEKGVINGKTFPTTYTIYLQNTGNTVPTSIATMTDNVKNNGYSETNQKSAAKAFQSNFNTLLTYMMEEIVTPMLTRSSGLPNKIVISSPGVGSVESEDTTGGEFVFSRRLPVDTSAVTPVNIELRYKVQIDSATSSGDIVHITRDSLFTYNFGIRRTANESQLVNWEARQRLKSTCYRAPTLDLQYTGTSLTGPGGMVMGYMDVLQIVFDNSNGLFLYDSVVVTVLNQVGGEASDTERFKLVKGNDGKWTFQFPREVKDIEAAKKNDGKLQNTGMGDSVILIFRNPDVPLDTIRFAVPYVSNLMAFYDVPGDPANGTRLPDTVSVKVNERLDIYAKIFNDGVWAQDIVPDNIKWYISDSTSTTVHLIKDPDDKSHAMFSSIAAGGTYTVTAIYTNGSLVITTKVTIKVNPGEPVNTAGPNPFVPGSSNIMEHLMGLSNSSPEKVEFYESIVAGSASGGGPRAGGADNVNGILVAATGSKPIQPNGGGMAGGKEVKYAKATAIIYDAVGHIVFKSKKEDIILANDGNTFGFVWSGKNTAGRTVGPGTYLLRMNATMANNEKFSYQRMIGVTVKK
ncbi:hypothetical protein R80B4_01779 [Fibrobacteres bacterium R8-0-B4]